MRIRINLYMDLAEKLKWSHKELYLEKEKITLRELLNILRELREIVISNPDRFLILVNGINVRFLKDLDTELSDGTIIDIFPPSGGG